MRIATISSVDDKAIVYWEHQEEGMMTCGVHCLNTLLQVPYFDEVELAQIALQLDKQERSLMGGRQLSSVSPPKHTHRNPQTSLRPATTRSRC